MSIKLDTTIQDGEELAKQRRNIMITASIIILIYFVGIKVTNINLGITGLSFENSKMLFYLLQIALGYFLLRYFVLFLRVKSIHNSKIYNTFYESILNYLLSANDDLIHNAEMNTKLKLELTIYLKQYKLFEEDFICYLEDGDISPIGIKKEVFTDYLNQTILHEIWSGIGIINYIFPILFASFTLLFTLFYTLDPKEKPTTSFKDMGTSIQIQDFCEEYNSFDSLNYKMCVKDLEKKLY